MALHDERALVARLRALRVFDDKLPAFAPERAPEQPGDLFREWLLEAIECGVRAPHAMTLSTVDGDGHPDARVLILRGTLGDRWEFASSRASRKGRELAAAPWAALTFHWPERGRQVRVRGRVDDAGPAAAGRDFLARGPGSRAESLPGRQSAELSNRGELRAAFARARELVDADPSLVPEHWALFRLEADEVEFWQADRERQHVRLQYARAAAHWRKTLLWP
ncbi:MAG: pyridoxal 5'-phosphate synthase [Solirubrobacteraceae bacterium]